MIRKLMILLILLMIPLGALAELRWTEAPDLIRPGKAVRLTFRCEEEATLTLLDASRTPRLTLGEALVPQDGLAQLFWDGTDGGEPLPPGDYVLFLHSGGETAEIPLTIGEPAPVITRVEADAICDGHWRCAVETDTAGTLTLTLVTPSGEEALAEADCAAGETVLSWDGSLGGSPVAEGEYEVMLRLRDETGFSATPQSLHVTVEYPRLATDTLYHTPGELTGVACGHDACYWTLPMGEMNEEAIWEVLTQPITVLTGDDRKQIALRALPQEDCRDYTGDVTCHSQGVHVLETQGEWTKVQAYSSSVGGSKSAVWALPAVGWVKTSLLETRQVDQTYGIVIDKLQQRLYVFKEGKLFTTLMCSTGIPTRDAPYNETPAGEFCVVSWTGGFWSGENNDMYCDSALRINGGILLHEVPCYPEFDEDGRIVDKDFANFESFLGQKASHGCVRIQRRESPEGVNMRWLWDNLNRKVNTKVIIWDEIGRVLGYPDPGVTLYYNPDGGKNYHSSATCLAVKEAFWPLTPFSYGELDSGEFAELTRCKSCAPQLRREEIDQLNARNTRGE